jgi:hypothetical protein
MGDSSVFVIISQDSTVLEVDEGFCNLIEHPKHIVQNRLLLELVHPEDHPTVVNAFIDVFYGIHTPKTYKFRLISSRGHHIHADAIITPDRSNSNPTASIELSLAS